MARSIQVTWGTRFALISAYLFCVNLTPLPAAGQLAQQILPLTGQKRVKMVWGRDTTSAGDHVFGDSNDFELHGYDTDTDSIVVIMSTHDDYTKPLITHDGTRIVYTDRIAQTIHVIDWDGTNKRNIANGFAGAVWFDSSTNKEWVYFQLNGNGDNSSNPLRRVNLDNTSETELIWDDTQTNTLWLSISGDGARLAGSWPWSACGAIEPNHGGGGGGNIYYSNNGYYDSGCWTTITPDTNYRVGVFDGPHRAWKVWDWPTGSRRMLDLHSAPGINGWEIYHPKHSNHPQFITMTGPYSQGNMGANNIRAGGPQVEVYFGKTDAGFTQVTSWIRMTNNNRADFFPDAWVAAAAVPTVRIDSFGSNPTVISEGAATTLSWDTTNATSVSINNGVGTVNASGSTSVSPATTTTYTITAEGTGGPVSRQTTVTVIPSGPVHLKINSGDGSPAVSGWDDESAFRTGGNEFDFSGSVDLNGQTNPADPDLYLTCVHQNHSYDFPVADGSYTVRLHFYDQYGGNRAMDYTIEGVKVLDDFDIAGEAGGAERVLIREFVVDVSDGNGMQIVAEQDGGNDVFETGIEIIARQNDTEDPTITITAPAAQATITGDVTIEGTASDNVGLDKVEVGFDSGPFSDATGRTNWSITLPTGSLSDGSHTIVARAIDQAGNSATDSVDITTDNATSIQITSPVGGESWDGGSLQHIQWTTHNLDNVSIFYSLDSGNTFTQLAQTVFDTEPEWGNYPWTLPNVPTNEARVMISGYFGESPTESGLFTIVATSSTSVTVTSPTGGETLTGRTDHTIRFSAEGVDDVTVDYSLNRGSTWNAIGPVSRGDADWGAVVWTLPNVSTSEAQIRVSASPTVFGLSGVFTIEPESTTASDLEVDTISVTAAVPAGAIESVRVLDQTVPVSANGSITFDVPVPLGVESVVFSIEGENYSRIVTVEIESRAPPIPGLSVNRDELMAFLGGKTGVLLFVDGGGQIQKLDFRNADPTVEVVAAETACVNPLIAPDGSRFVYSFGAPNGPKVIFVKSLTSDDKEQVATGDIGFWNVDSGTESIIYCDWSAKNDNGQGGATFKQELDSGAVTLSGTPTQIHNRAMDAGPNGDMTWLGQVYGNLIAYNLSTSTEYATDKFFLMEGTVADHQTCNGSMAPDASGRLMELVDPHDWIRVFSHDTTSDTFKETSRFELPAGYTEWRAPEWSTNPDYFTAGMRRADLKSRLFIVKMVDGNIVPEVLEVAGPDWGPTYSHLYVEP